MRYNVGESGGPDGPFYSVIRQDGRVVAIQIPDEETANTIAELLTIKEQAESGPHWVVLDSLHLTLQTLRKYKPNDKSELDRRYAVTITEFEKVLAYFRCWIVDNFRG